MGVSFLVMLMPIIMIAAIAGIGVAVYRRISSPPGGAEGGAFQEKLLFEIDRLQVQMQIANERLERLESGLRSLPRGDDTQGSD